MANVIAIVSFFVGFVLTIAAASAWCCVLFPSATRRSRLRLEVKFWQCLAAGGLVLSFCTILFCAFLLYRPFLIEIFSSTLEYCFSRLGINRVANDAMMLAHAVGWSLVCPFLSTGLIGLASIAEIFSSKLLVRKQSPFSLASILYGSALPVMACCIPIVGWFFVAPVLALACLGSGFCGVFAAELRSENVLAVK